MNLGRHRAPALAERVPPFVLLRQVDGDVLIASSPPVARDPQDGLRDAGGDRRAAASAAADRLRELQRADGGLTSFHGGKFNRCSPA